MLTRETTLACDHYAGLRHGHTHGARLSGLYLVTAHDVRHLDDALAHGEIPSDFERKLKCLAGGSLLERYVEQNCRLLISVLLASRHGLFRDLSPEQSQKIVRVLAYVRKDEDAIPDYRLDGFKDDAQELREVALELAPMLERFKAWRLRHQVPALWARADAHSNKPRAADF